MDVNKSLDESKLIAAYVRDVLTDAHGLGLEPRSVRLTLDKLAKRLRFEGVGFLTKTLPRLGKAFDKALTHTQKLNATELGFSTLPGSELPRFLGELFSRVLQPDGSVLQEPCAKSVLAIREICYLFYKYELPYTTDQERTVIDRFVKTDEDLSAVNADLQSLEDLLNHHDPRSHPNSGPNRRFIVARRARKILSNLFAFFDPSDIRPRHGPGAVATKQQRSEKFLWRNVSSRITDVYPFDAYFCASSGHVCDTYNSFTGVTDESLPARVVLVAKDSRGPRLISCEPVDYQWVQQGLGRSLVELVESHKLTKGLVNFTHQYPNQCGALWGSQTGRYATLDLNEASDRVSTGLVRLLFPSHVYTYLDACRSLYTELPDGRIITLNKFAPMGSSLCFPVLAITVWAILTAAARDLYTRERILVYGDDVIVPTAFAEDAIEQLESFGLKVNKDKSCTNGFFRESCGCDAFKGVKVTPVRIRTVWSSTPSPDSYVSWIAYANQFYDRKCYRTYDYIVECLTKVYGDIPGQELNLSAPSLRQAPDGTTERLRRRTNNDLQKQEYRVRDVEPLKVTETIAGWSMLLRYFTEVGSSNTPLDSNQQQFSAEPASIRGQIDSLLCQPAFAVSQYTRRRTSMLVRRWR